MRSRALVLALTASVAGLSSCIDGSASEPTLEVEGAIGTQEANHNGTLEGGEMTQPTVNVSCVMKPLCSDDIYVEWSICLVEKFNNNGKPTEAISIDLNGNPICASFRTDFPCENNKLGNGSSKCLGGDYCSAIVPAANTPMTCGWRILDGQVFNADGSLIEGLSVEKLESFGYDLLPVEQTNP